LSRQLDDGLFSFKVCGRLNPVPRGKQMRKHFLIVALAITMSIGSSVYALNTSTYRITASGVQVTAAGTDKVSFNCQAVGDLAGPFSFTADYDRTTNAVVGGTWTLVVLEPDAEGVSHEVGRLTGSIASGTAEFGPDGKLTNVSGMQLTFSSGEGRYQEVTTGSGTLDRTEASADGPPYAYALSLTF
jgi:hypothetical protein